MILPQSLQTIAEISIAFAGFSGLVVALRKSPGPLTDVQKYRLRVLLTLAFGAMFLALLPELLANFGLGEEETWRWSHLAITLYSAVFVSWWLSSSARMRRVTPEIFHWFALTRMTAGHIVILVLQVSVILGWVEDRHVGAYLAGLVWYLLHAAQQFARMLFIQPKSTEHTGP